MSVSKADSPSDDGSAKGVISPPYSRTTTLVASPGSPLTPRGDVVVHRHYWRVASAFFCFFAIGWGDAATGVILPDFQATFHLNFIMASMLFMTGSVGYALATFIVEPVAHVLGKFKLSAERSGVPAVFTRDATGYSVSQGRYLSLFFFGILHCIYFMVSACSPHYYGVLIAFFIGGIGKSILIAQFNVYWTTNPRCNGIALLHGTYGVGAFVSPLVSQTMRAHKFPWRGFFWVSLGLAVCNVFFILFAFRTTPEEFATEKGLSVASKALSQENHKQHDIETGSGQGGDSKRGMWAIICTPYVWVIATVLGTYQGAETIAQGFIVSFLLRERHADPNSVGYVASGFWGGLALGRVIWGIVGPRFSQRVKIHYVNYMLALGMVFHVIIWRVNSVIVDAVTVSLLGLLAGPIFPLVLDIATSRQKPGESTALPVFSPDVQLTALAIGSSVGAMGGATFSLTAGIVANKHGAFAVEPLAMATLMFVFCFWVGTQIVCKIVRK